MTVHPLQPADALIPTERHPQRSSSRRAAILAIAVELFATRGYHGVSMDDIGAAAGVTGPALYHHFAGKEAMLVAAIAPVSESLLAGARQLARKHHSDSAALVAAFVEFHVAFAVDNPAVIALNMHELDRLPDESRATIRRIQRAYVEEWVNALLLTHPEWDSGRALAATHAVLGLMNSTPFLRGDSAPEITQRQLGAMALGALRAA